MGVKKVFILSTLSAPTAFASQEQFLVYRETKTENACNIGHTAMNLIHFYRIAHRLYRWKIPLLPKIVYYFQRLIFNSSLPATAVIGEGTTFAYGGIGVVVHGNAVIGSGCVLGQGITIGGRSKNANVPTIGNNVYIGAGARILGPITIGDEVVIGPNAVVIKDIPSNSIAVGIPSRIVRTGIKMADHV